MSPGLEQQGEDGGLIVDLETSTIGVIKASAIGYLFKPDNLVAFLFFFQFFTKKTFETWNVHSRVSFETNWYWNFFRRKEHFSLTMFLNYFCKSCLWEN